MADSSGGAPTLSGDAGEVPSISAHRNPEPERWPLLAAIGTLAVSNVVANRFLPRWAYVPWNSAVTAVLVGIAVIGDDCTLEEIGLASRRLPDGIRWGSLASGGLISVYVAGVAAPPTRDLFRDDRGDIPLRSLMWQGLVVVPAGTVMMEEVAFRGVLPAMLRRRMHTPGPGLLASRTLRADATSAALFGLWHVLPSWDVNESNPVFRRWLPGPLGRLAALSGAVAGTAAAGMVFSWLRNRSGSLAAPALLHNAVNSTGYVMSWTVQRAVPAGRRVATQRRSRTRAVSHGPRIGRRRYRPGE